MITESINKILKQYVLHQLFFDEAEELEEKLLNDEEFYQQYEKVENELINSYVREEMPDEERRLFEENYLIFSENKQKVEEAEKKLNRREQVVVALAQPEISWTQWISAFLKKRALQTAFVAAALIFVIGLVILISPPWKTEEISTVPETNSNSSGNQNQLAQSGDDTKTPENRNISNTGIPLPNPPQKVPNEQLAQRKDVPKTDVRKPDEKAIAQNFDRTIYDKGVEIFIEYSGTQMGDANKITNEAEPKTIKRDALCCKFSRIFTDFDAEIITKKVLKDKKEIPLRSVKVIKTGLKRTFVVPIKSNPAGRYEIWYYDRKDKKTERTPKSFIINLSFED
jgi:hypothetical protein